MWVDVWRNSYWALQEEERRWVRGRAYAESLAEGRLSTVKGKTKVENPLVLSGSKNKERGSEEPFSWPENRLERKHVTFKLSEQTY